MLCAESIVLRAEGKADARRGALGGNAAKTRVWRGSDLFFGEALTKYFAGRGDAATLAILARQQEAREA